MKSCLNLTAEMETMQTWTSGIHDVFCDTTSYPYHQQEYGYSDSSSDGDGAAAQCAYPTTPSDQYENYPQTTAYDNYTTLNPMGYDTPYTNSPCRVQTVLQEPGGSLRDDDNSNSSGKPLLNVVTHVFARENGFNLT